MTGRELSDRNVDWLAFEIGPDERRLIVELWQRHIYGTEHLDWLREMSSGERRRILSLGRKGIYVEPEWLAFRYHLDNDACVRFWLAVFAEEHLGGGEPD